MKGDGRAVGDMVNRGPRVSDINRKCERYCAVMLRASDVSGVSMLPDCYNHNKIWQE